MRIERPVYPPLSWCLRHSRVSADPMLSTGIRRSVRRPHLPASWGCLSWERTYRLSCRRLYRGRRSRQSVRRPRPSLRLFCRRRRCVARRMNPAAQGRLPARFECSQWSAYCSNFRCRILTSCFHYRCRIPNHRYRTTSRFRCCHCHSPNHCCPAYCRRLTMSRCRRSRCSNRANLNRLACCHLTIRRYRHCRFPRWWWMSRSLLVCCRPMRTSFRCRRMSHCHCRRSHRMSRNLPVCCRPMRMSFRCRRMSRCRCRRSNTVSWYLPVCCRPTRTSRCRRSNTVCRIPPVCCRLGQTHRCHTRGAHRLPEMAKRRLLPLDHFRSLARLAQSRAAAVCMGLFVISHGRATMSNPYRHRRRRHLQNPDNRPDRQSDRRRNGRRLQKPSYPLAAADGVWLRRVSPCPKAYHILARRNE